MEYQEATCCSRGKRLIYYEETHHPGWYLGVHDGSGVKANYLEEPINYCPFCGKRLKKGGEEDGRF